MADEEGAGHEAQDFRHRMIEVLTQGEGVNQQCLSVEDIEAIVDDLGPFIRPLLIELRDARLRESRLSEQLQIAEKRSNYRMSEFGRDIAELQRQIASNTVTTLRAKLLEAEVDQELRKAGFESPLGIRGVRDAMGFLKRHRDDANERHGFLNRIADVVSPDDKATRVYVRKTAEGNKEAVEQVAKIIEEFETDEH